MHGVTDRVRLDVKRPRPSAFFVAGPTAVGKSSVAVRLAEAVGGEIVNADPFQLFRGLEIITAAPPPGDRERVPHHLFGILDPREPVDAASFAARVRPVIEEVAGRGRLPILVGGSGLYLKSVSHGLSPLPRADPALRAALETLAPEERVAWLRRLDPEGAAAMDLRNPRHVERALEISLLAGRPASELRRDWHPGEAPPDATGILLDLADRGVLHERINRRVGEMIAAGALEEVGRAAPRLGPTAARAIGVPEILAHLGGMATLSQTVAAMQTATRRYARRQLTWFRRERWLQTICLGSGDDATTAVDRILAGGIVPPSPRS